MPRRSSGDERTAATIGIDRVAGEPYFHAMARDEEVEVFGPPQVFCGHRLPRAGAPDDGVFATWSWKDGQLRVQNDRYGIHPLFYFSRPGEVAVSTSLLRLIALGAPLEIDDEALAVFLRLGFFVGNDTPFRAIRAVPPNVTFQWEPARFVVSGGYVQAEPCGLTREQALDAYIEAFRRAIQRRLPVDARFSVPLSGGRDSRHILLELCHLGYRPQFCITIPRYPPRAPEDERVAALLTRELGVPHTLLPQLPRTAQREAHKNTLTHMCADEHTWYLPMIEHLERSGATVYDGMGGALSVAGRFLSPSRLTMFGDGRFDDLAEDILKRFGVLSEGFLNRVLHPRYREKLGWNRAKRRLARDLRLHAGAPDPTKSFNFWNRTRREIALVPYGMMRRVRAVFSPYLDHDVYDLLFSLPPRLLSTDLSSPNKSFHSDAIRRAYPKYAQVPFEDSSAPSLPSNGHFRRYGASVASHFFATTRKPLSIIDSRYVWPRLAWSFVQPEFWEKRAWLPGVLMYLWQLEHARELASLLDRANGNGSAR